MGRGPQAIILEPNDGCLTVERTLARRGIEVVVMAGPDTRYAARSRLVDGRRLPPPAADPIAWLRELEAVAARGPGVLIAGSDAASELLARYRADIPGELRSFESVDGPHLHFMSKSDQYAVAERAGVRTPWTKRVGTPAELEAVSRAVAYPCIVKPDLAHVGKRAGGFHTEIVSSPAQLSALARPAIAAGIPLVLSEYLDGHEERLEGAVLIRLADGSYPVAIGKRKVRQHPRDCGVGSLHECWDLPEAVATARRLLDAVGFVGVCNFEGKRHRRTGELVFIEINVRVPGGYGVTEACGIDGSWRLYAALAGIPLPPQPAPVYGAKCLLPQLDALEVAGRLRRHELRLGETIASYRGVRDAGVLDLRDPVPALRLARDMVRHHRSQRHQHP